MKPNLAVLSKQFSTLRLLNPTSSSVVNLRGRVLLFIYESYSSLSGNQSSAQETPSAAVVQPHTQLKSVSKALERYLKNVREYEKMMAKERAEFELGKRYLANIMGWDSANVTQDDIDKAIEYLFPSGLTDKKARPVMKPPEEILPKFHKYEFDKEGRPKDSLFFTLKPRFYGLLSVSETF